jgi:large subunit ribosomal protein L4
LKKYRKKSMASKQTLNYKVHALSGEASSETSITLNVQNINPKYLLHRAVILQNNKSRQGTASSKTRSEVKGGGKKPWKQKGTGRARSGSANSPLWRGGGVAFGPKPKTSTKKINNKEKKLALTTALYCAAHKTIIVEDNFVEIEKPSTKNFITKVNKLSVIEANFKTLIITHKATPNTILSIRNLPNFQILSLENLALKQVLSAKKIIMTEQALSKLNTL